MTDRDTLRAERPHFRAMCRDGSAWLLDLAGYAAFDHAWDAGKPFWTGKCAYGSTVKVKLADITGLSVWDEARLAVEVEENEVRKQRELTEGTA